MSAEPELAKLLKDTVFFKCPQCEDNVTNPVILTCLHTLCQGCHGNSQQVQQGTSGGCPVCVTLATEEGTGDKRLKPQDAAKAYKNHFMSSLKELADCKDPEIEKRCTYCQFENKCVVAVSRCLECGDNVCVDCVQIHKKTKLTREHTVLSFQQIQNGQYDADIRQSQPLFCGEHKAEHLKYLCHRCGDQLICRECRVSQHADHSCTAIEKASSRFIGQNTTLLNTLKSKAQKLGKLEDFMEDYNDHVEQTKVKVVREIEGKAEMLHDMVEKYRAGLIEEIMPAVLEEQSRNEERIRNVQSQRRLLEDCSTYLDRLFQHGKPDEILDSGEIIKERLSQLVHLPVELVTSQLNVKFRHGTRTLGANESVFGKVEVYHSPLSEDSVKEISNEEDLSLSCVMPNLGETVELVREFECKGLSDTKDIWPSGISVDITGNMLIVDRENKKVKVFDGDGKLQREFGHTGPDCLKAPYDLTVLMNGNLAVTDYEDECVKVFSHTGQFLTSWKEHFKHPRGITTDCNGQVVVVDCNKKRVTVHDPDTGAMVTEIRGKDKDKCDLFNDPYYVTTNSNNYTVVTDWIAPNIKLFDDDLKYLARYGTYGVNRDRVLQPYGVCTDSYGYIFVADNQNNRIHLLDPSGKFVRFLLHEKHGLWHPMALAVNQDGHLVITEALGKVKIFKYL